MPEERDLCAQARFRSQQSQTGHRFVAAIRPVCGDPGSATKAFFDINDEWKMTKIDN
jgi:hypothetical protein